MTSEAKYKVITTFPLRGTFPFEKSVYNEKFTIFNFPNSIFRNMKDIKVEFSFAHKDEEITRMGIKTYLIVYWEFTDFFLDGRYNPNISETFLEACKRGNYLDLQEYTIFPIADCWNIIKIEIMKMSISLRAPSLYFDCLKSLEDALPTAEIHVNNQKIEIISTTLLVGPVDIVGIPGDDKKLKNTIKSKLHEYQFHVFIADERLMAGDMRGAITNLNTAMEVAGYEFARPKLVNNDFSPQIFFKKHINKKGQVDTPKKILDYFTAHGEMDSDIFDNLFQLYETRNNIVHEGLLELYEPSRPSKRGPLHDDYYRFRTALSSALIWMGLNPIE